MGDDYFSFDVSNNGEQVIIRRFVDGVEVKPASLFVIQRREKISPEALHAMFAGLLAS